MTTSQKTEAPAQDKALAAQEKAASAAAAEASVDVLQAVRNLGMAFADASRLDWLRRNIRAIDTGLDRLAELAQDAPGASNPAFHGTRRQSIQASYDALTGADGAAMATVLSGYKRRTK